MAKKKALQRNRNPKSMDTVDLSLPQNMALFGEPIPEDKKVYISQEVYNEIHRFTKDKTTNESGGVLLGNVIEEFGKTHIIIRAFIEAKFCEATPTTLKFTHESWDYIHKEKGKKNPEYKILGWIHTHPDFGIFLSEYDKFIHENFFNEGNQVAYVVDPIQNIEGFYYWLNGTIERCKGFFVFDKTGVKITVKQESEDDSRPQTTGLEKNFLIKNLVITVMGIAIVALLFICLSLHSKVNVLQTQQQALVDSANTSMYNMSIQISSLYSEIDALKAKISSFEPEENDFVEQNGTDSQEPSVDENDIAESTPAVNSELDTEDEQQKPEASNKQIDENRQYE